MNKGKDHGFSSVEAIYFDKARFNDKEFIPLIAFEENDRTLLCETGVWSTPNRQHLNPAKTGAWQVSI
jgi:hypothetical protein